MKLITLKMVYLIEEGARSRLEIIKEMTRWMYEDFRKSQVGLIWLILSISKKKIKNTYKSPRNSSNPNVEIENMTWDLYLTNTFNRNWTDKKRDYSLLYVSEDNPLTEALELAYQLTFKQCASIFSNHLGKIEMEYVQKYLNNECNFGYRKYHGNPKQYEIRDELIYDLEEKVKILVKN